MLFTLNRNRVVVGLSGHAIEFVKDKPVFVPKEMHEAVLAVGAVPSEEIVDDEQPKGDEPNDAAERAVLIRAAVEQIAAKNNIDDFTAAGAPKLDAVSAAVKFKVTAKELAPIWGKFKLGDKDE